MVIYMYDIVHT